MVWIQEWLLTQGEMAQIFVFFSFLLLFLLLEMLWPRRTPSTPQRSRRVVNFTMTALNVAALSFVPISFVGVAVWAEQSQLGLLHQVSLPIGWVLGLGLLARGFISFGTHYLNHKVPWLWRIHRVHHLDTELDVSSTVRMHPLEFFVNPLIGMPLVVVLGLSPWTLVLYELLDAGITLFSHSNVRLPVKLDRVLKYIIVTPDLHRIHHSVKQPETDSNFSAVLPVWDMIFGTFRAYPEDGHEFMRLGLDQLREQERQGLLALLLSPFRTFSIETPAMPDRPVTRGQKMLQERAE